MDEKKVVMFGVFNVERSMITAGNAALDKDAIVQGIDLKDLERRIKERSESKRQWCGEQDLPVDAWRKWCRCPFCQASFYP